MIPPTIPLPVLVLVLVVGCGRGEVPYSSARPIRGMSVLEHRDAPGFTWEVEPIEGEGAVATLVLSQEWPAPLGAISRLGIPGLEPAWTTPGGPAGFHVVATPDLDGDRVADLATTVYVTGIREDVVVVSGRTGEAIVTHAGDDRVGVHVGAVGDVDGDGTPDLVLGAYSPDREERGVVEAISGADGAILWSVEGAPGEFLGVDNLVSIDDRDRDGLRDVATQGYASRFGSVPILSAASGERIDDVSLPDADAGLCREAGDVDGDGTPELLLQTVAEGIPTLHVWSFAQGVLWSRERFGCAAFGTRDVDADGLPDVIAAEGLEAPGRALALLAGTTGDERFRSVSGAALGADVTDLPQIDGWAAVDRREGGGLWLWVATY